MKKALTIIGIGDDGCRSLTSRAMNAVAQAQVLIGGQRHLAFFPEFSGRRLALQNGIGEVIRQLPQLCAEQNVCVLASGDPLFFGVGSLVLKAVGPEHVDIVPHVSSMQWAFARIGQKWDDAAWISVHGRSREGFVTRLHRLRKVACLTDAENSPSVLAGEMLRLGQTGWRAWVCENLGGPDERIREFTLAALAACRDIGALNILILQRTDPDWRSPPALAFIHEDDFAKRMPKKGLITKREVRTLALGALRLRPDSVLWDIGAGSGSVSIEAAWLAYEGRVYAVEVDPEGVEICHENIRAYGVDNVRVIAGRAPEALTALEAPEAVFMGGSQGSMREILAVCLERLRPGGRLVSTAITLENVGETYRALRERGLTPEVLLVNVSRGAPLAKYVRYEALNPVHIFTIERP